MFVKRSYFLKYELDSFKNHIVKAKYLKYDHPDLMKRNIYNHFLLGDDLFTKRTQKNAFSPRIQFELKLLVRLLTQLNFIIFGVLNQDKIMMITKYVMK